MRSWQRYPRFFLLFRSILFLFALFLWPVVATAQAEETAQPDGAAPLSGKLVIYSGLAFPKQVGAMEEMIAGFTQVHPEIDVVLRSINIFAFTPQFRDLLINNPPDVITWTPGNKLRPYAVEGLIEPVDDVWAAGDLHMAMAPTKTALSYKEHVYGVPISQYPWGIVYRRDIFDKLGLSPPQTWEEQLENCRVIQDAGISCFGYGQEFKWTAAAWFDYLNLRVNGAEFHCALTQGEIAWTDARVTNTFQVWAALVDEGVFSERRDGRHDAFQFFVEGEAAAVLTGSYSIRPLREGGMDDTKIGFYRFPQIASDVPMAEIAPIDSLHIPSGAQNKDAARAFLRYAAQPAVQSILNEADAFTKLPVHSKALPEEDVIFTQGFTMLTQQTPGGVVQFFDQNTKPEMALRSLAVFRKMMAGKIDPSEAQESLEELRQEIYR